MNKIIAIPMITIFISLLTQATQKGEAMKEFYKNKKVLVTGGCGFIGSHLAQKLVNLGSRVTILDDLSTGKIENIQPFKGKVTFIHASIVDADICKKATKNVDIIFHLGAFISVPQSVDEPRQCHKINVDGTFNLLEAARINNVTRFVFSSSSAVYGTNENLNKETQRCFPDSPYGMSKLVGELYCKQYALHYGLTTVMLRYFNVFGERQNPHAQYAAVIAKFKYQMHNDLPITIFGDGLQSRDFIAVHDVVDANLTLGMLHKESVNGEIYNIATGKSTSILELASILKKEFPDYQQKIIFAPPRQGDPKHSRADCTKYYSLQQTIFSDSPKPKQLAA